jgi:hypothetical protein
MSRRKGPITADLSDNAITWFFAGLLIIAAVAGLFGQVVPPETSGASVGF